MSFEIISILIDTFGLYTIDVKINNRSYTYIINSAYAYNLIKQHYQKGRYAQCMAMLNKWNVKKEVI